MNVVSFLSDGYWRMIAATLVRYIILKWVLMVSKSVFELFLNTALGTLIFDNCTLISVPILSSRATFFSSALRNPF